MISMAASARIVDPANPKTRWVFKVPQNDSLMADAIAVHMKANGVKTLGYIGFNDAYGESWLARDQALGADGGHQGRRRREIQPQRRVGDRAGAEARRGQSGCDPDRRVRHARRRRRRRSSSRAATRARSTRRTASPIPISCACAAPTATARCCRSGRCSCSSSCPISNPVKKVAAQYITQYEAKYGKDSRTTFGGHAYDPFMLLSHAVPEALKKAKPGTKEFRAALRDALESEQRRRRRTACSS